MAIKIPSLKGVGSFFGNMFSGFNLDPKMLISMLPMLQQHLEQINQPIEQGGLKKEGEDHIAYMVTIINNKPLILVCAINDNEGNPKLVRNIFTIGEDQLKDIQFDENEG